MNRRRLILLLITFVPAAVLFIAAVIYLIVQANRVAQGLDATLQVELEQYLEREVRVGQVETRPFGFLVVHNFAIADGETFEAGTLLTAERLEVRYNWVDLVLRRGPAIQTITSVRVIRPDLRLTRFTTGLWNITDLFRPPPEPRPPFTGVVTVVDGIAEIQDFLSGPPELRPAVTRVRRINGTADASAFPLVTFNSAMASDRVAEVDLSGRYNTRRGSLDMDLTARNANAPFWAAYRPILEPFTVQSGRFDARLSISRMISNGEMQWDYSGTADLRNLSATLPQTPEPLHQVSGRLEFTTEFVNLNLTGVAARSPLTAEGTIVLQPRANVRLVVESDALRTEALPRALPQLAQLQQIQLSGTGSARAVIVGPPGDLTVRATGHVPRAVLAGYQAAEIDLSVSYARGIVRIARATGRTLHGRVTTSGFIDVSVPSFPLELSGTAHSIDLALIPPAQDLGLLGRADARFAVAGTLESPIIDINAQVSRGTLDNLAFSNATMSLRAAAGILTIHNLTANTMGGAVRLSGTVTPTRVDMNLAALGINVAEAFDRFGLEGYGGVGYFQGRVSGPLADPSVVGTIEIFDGRVAGVEFDYARSRIAGARTAIALTDGIIRRETAEAQFSGRISDIATAQPRFDLALEVDQVAVQELLQNFDIAVDAAGTLSASLTVTGLWPDVVVAGDFTLTDGRVAGIAITSAGGRIVYRDGVAGFADLHARTNGTTLTAEGSIAADGSIRFAFSGQDVRLAELNEALHPYLALRGTANVSGNIGGTLETPTVGVSVVSADLEINAQRFDRFSAQASWDGQTIRLSDVALTADGEAYTISQMAFNTETSHLTAQAGASGGRIERLLAIVRRSNYLATPGGQRITNILARIPQPVSGAVDASLSVSGRLDQLQGTLQASTQNVILGAQTLDSAELLITADRGNIILTRFAAVSGDLNVTASGDILRDDRVNLDIEAYNLDLALLRPWTGPIGLTGVATVTALISGPFLAPSIQASVEMVSPTVAGFQFDRIRASQIHVTSNQIELSDVILTRDGYRASIAGVLPWDWNTLSIPPNLPILLQAQLDEQPLALLAALTGAVETEGTGGTVDGDIELRGSLERPELTGTLSVTNGSINFAALITPGPQGPSDFTGINATIEFDGDRINIVDFSGEAAAGGTFDISGSVVLADFPNGAVDLRVTTNEMHFSAQNLSGIYNEIIVARLTSDLAVTGPASQPLVSGDVSLTDTQVRISARQPTEPRPEFVFPINPNLDITITAGREVWISNPSVRAMVTGSARLTGTANEPVIRGALIVQRGTIRLPTARLDLRRGGVISIAYVPPEPGRIVLDLEATTSTSARSLLGPWRRYNIVMSIRGPLENLSLDVRSEPPGLPTERIYAMLGQVEGLFDSGELALRQELTDIFTAAVVPEIFGPIETAFEQLFNLEEFRLQYGREEPLAIFLSRHLFGDFYASYWSVLSGAAGEEDYRLSLSYRWTDRLQLSISTNDQNETIFEVEGILRY